MAHWTDTETESHHSVGDALAVVDRLLGLAKDTQGKPSREERALFAAAVVFTYGIWENYVEQLAIEIAGRVSAELSPEKVPDVVKKALEKKTAWELTVSPGWRALWLERVRVAAVGDTEEKFGMNTARAGQVENLLVQAGVADPFESISDDVVPDHLPVASRTFRGAVDELVKLRGEIVHTGKVPETLRKAHVRSWRSFAEHAADRLDASCRTKCKKLLT